MHDYRLSYCIFICFSERADPCMTEADCMNTTCTHGAPICEMHEHAEDNGRCKCHAPEGKSDLMQSEWCYYLGQTLSNARI